MTLFEKDGISQSEIGKYASMPGYATTRNIDTLEEEGILKRHKNKESRRSFCIYLTNKGLTLAPELFSIVEKINTRVLEPLTKTEAKQLNLLLTKLMN